MSQERSCSRSPTNLLLVDDREEDLLALEVILEGPDLRLVKASSGPRALRSVLEEDFAVVLLDVTMPGMNGFEVAAIIKQRARNRHTPIIFLTSEGKDLDSIYRGYEAGGVDYILKPLDPDIVKAKVAVFVELHRRGEEIKRQAELLHEGERARRELELDELRQVTEARYRNLAEALPQIVWTARRDGEAAYFNHRWTDHTGLLPAQSLGHGWQTVLHPDDVQRFVEQWGCSVATGEPLRTECRLRSSAGGYVWHLCDVRPERGGDERVLGWLGTFTDVDGQKQLEAERARLRANIAVVERQLGRLAPLIDSMLDVSRIGPEALDRWLEKALRDASDAGIIEPG